MNRVTLYGNLAADPETKYIEAKGKQTAVTTFTVAHSRYFTKADGSKGSEPTYLQCVAWDKSAETIGKFFSKGSPILLEGSLFTEIWEKDGQKNYRQKIRVSNFFMVGGKRDNKPVEETSSVTNEPNDSDNDIPF